MTKPQYGRAFGGLKMTKNESEMGAMADITSVLTSLGTVSTWFWSLFNGLVNLIASNSLLLIAVIFAIVAGSLGLAMRVVRKFGVKGRR